jgi:hypothetical protein
MIKRGSKKLTWIVLIVEHTVLKELAVNNRQNTSFPHYISSNRQHIIFLNFRIMNKKR